MLSEGATPTRPPITLGYGNSLVFQAGGSEEKKRKPYFFTEVEHQPRGRRRSAKEKIEVKDRVLPRGSLRYHVLYHGVRQISTEKSPRSTDFYPISLKIARNITENVTPQPILPSDTSKSAEMPLLMAENGPKPPKITQKRQKFTEKWPEMTKLLLKMLNNSQYFPGITLK